MTANRFPMCGSASPRSGRLTALLATVFLGLATPPSAHATIISTFDRGPDGWTSTGGVTWQPTGGNPGGYLRYVDTGPPLYGQIIAPASFLGDWSALNEAGDLRFDFRVFATVPPFGANSAHIRGPGGAAVWFGPVWTEPSDWTTLIAPIRASQWTVQSGTWTDLLADVTELRLLMPTSSSLPDVTGVDNVRLSAVPEPGCLTIAGATTLGLLGFAWCRRRWSAKSGRVCPQDTPLRSRVRPADTPYDTNLPLIP